MLMERLLWLSNVKPSTANSELVHRVLVKGDACRFLASLISHAEYPDPEDIDRWTVKGLAMTCLGNILENMDEQQCRDHVTEAMIDAVVAIKGNADVPLMQKRQAVFTLQRYTLATDRHGIQQYYREDTSNMDEGIMDAKLVNEWVMNNEI